MVAASATCMANSVGCTRSIPVTVCGADHRLGDRESGLRGDQRLQLRATVAANTGSVASRSAPIAGPLRTLPGEHPDRAAVVLSDRGADTGSLSPCGEPRDLAQRAGQLGEVAGDHARCAPAGARAGAPGCSARSDSATVRALRHPVGEPARGLAQLVGRRSTTAGTAAGPRVGGLRPGRSSVSGACSRTACTLVPDIPYDDTAARRGLSSVAGPRGGSCGTTSPVSIRASSSGSRVKCSFGGTTPCCSARMALISPIAPAADSVWPTVGLRRSEHAVVAGGAVNLCQARELDRVADRGAGAVRLDHADGVGVDAGRGQRRPVHRDLGVRRRRRDVLGAAVLIGGGAAHHGQDAVAVAQRVRQSLEQHHAQPSERTKPSAPTSNVRQRPVGDSMPWARRRRESARFQHHRAAAGQGEVALAVVQAAASHVHREQTRRARRVHRDRRAVQPEGVGDPSGRQADGGAGEAVHLAEGARVGGQECVVGVGQPDEHTGLRARPATWVPDPRAPPPPRSLPAATGAAGRSRSPRARRSRRTRSRSPPRRRGTRPTATPTGRARRARGRSSSSASHRSAGISVTRSSPRRTASHSASGESMPPGSRHAMPMTAIGVTGFLLTAAHLFSPVLQGDYCRIPTRDGNAAAPQVDPLCPRHRS